MPETQASIAIQAGIALLRSSLSASFLSTVAIL